MRLSQQSIIEGRAVAQRKPDGGFCFISVEALLAAWWAYRRDFIRLADLRVWFACFELMARRYGLRAGISPRYTIEELQRLVGGANAGAARRSLRRLETAGLLVWTETKITSSSSVTCNSDEDAAGFVECLQLVTNHRRKVPVPRRVLRFIATCRRPVVIATTLGHLLRCLYYRNGRCEPNGTCKASWIAEVFEVDARNVKAARKKLTAIGLLVRGSTPQRTLNRWGLSVAVNLSWHPAGALPATESPPLSLRTKTNSPPPRENRKLSTRSVHQKPPARRLTGVCKADGRKPRPTLRNVVPIDLHDRKRLAELFEQALVLGLVRESESDRLRFSVAAMHATTIAKKNPCGLFVAIVRRKLWHVVTQQDEDSARRLMSFAPTLGRKFTQFCHASPPFQVVDHAAASTRAANILPVCLEWARAVSKSHAMIAHDIQPNKRRCVPGAPKGNAETLSFNRTGNGRQSNVQTHEACRGLSVSQTGSDAVLVEQVRIDMHLPDTRVSRPSSRLPSAGENPTTALTAGDL